MPQSEARFTPGPWTIEVPFNEDAFAIEGRAGYRIAKVINFNGFQANEANAHLISAAPDMYEALRWFIDDIDGNHTVMLDFDANVAKARLALSKALGSPDPARSVDEQGRGTAA